MRLSRWLSILALLCVAGGQLGAACGGPPKVAIDTPLHGDFVDAPSVLVTGRIVNIGPGGSSLVVNGDPVTVQPDRTWSYNLTLDHAAVFNPVLAELTNFGNGDKYRHRIVVVAGPAVADGLLSMESTALRINDEGLDQLEPEIAGLVDIDLPSLMTDDEYITSVSAVWNFDIYIDYGPLPSEPPRFDDFSMDIESQPGEMEAFIDLTNVRVDLFLDGTGFLAPDCTGRVTANLLEIDGGYALEPNGAMGGVDVVQQGGVSFGNTVFDFDITSGWVCDVAAFFGIIGSGVNEDIEAGLSSFLNAVDGNGNTPVAAAIEEALAAVEIAGPIGEGLGVTLDAPLFKVEEDVAGLTLGSDSAFTANVGTGQGQCDAPPDAPDFAFSLASTDPFPSFAFCAGGTSPGAPCLDHGSCGAGGVCEARTAVGGLPYGMGICVSRAAFNQLLKAQVECGLLVQTGTNAITVLSLGGGNPEPITASTLAVFVPEFGQYPPDMPFKIELLPTVAPVITDNPGAQGELAELKIAQLELRIVHNGAPGFVPIAGVMDVVVGLDIALDSQTGTLSFQLGSAAASDIDFVITKNNLGVDVFVLETYVLPGVISFFLPNLAGGLAEFPLPQFLGLQLNGVEVSRSGDFLSIFTDLTPAS